MSRDSRERQVLPLGDAIQQHLARETLDAGQLQKLVALQEAVLDDAAPQRRNYGGLRFQALAACALVLCCVILVWRSSMPSAVDYSEQIALEVIENHLKLKPLDVAADSMGEIQGFFTQLDFSPVKSRLLGPRFNLAEGSMLGGRYCSIKGVAAAQLRYRQNDDRMSTLYEVAYDPEAFGEIPSLDRGETPTELLLKGLRVTLWMEKGLLMVLVRDA